MARIDNRNEVARLFAEGRLAVACDPVGALPPPSPAQTTCDRVSGMMLGLAIGDSLGNTSESMMPSARRAWHGEVRDFLANRYADGRAVGLPSDDTQMAYWTLEALLDDGGLVPPHLVEHFRGRTIFGIGSTVRAFLAACERGEPWDGAGQPSAGNGALMRIAPVLLPHLRSPSSALWADALLAGMVTHNDFASNASCVAFVRLLWQALSLPGPPGPRWWLDTFCEAAALLEGEKRYAPRSPSCPQVATTLTGFTCTQVTRALAEGLSTVEGCNSWHSGAYLLETVPSVLFILERHGHDPEEAVVRAVNDTWDNDSVAAIVGAAAGALHGRAALPRRWRDGLLGRTGAEDDGRVGQLLEAAEARFGPR